jgi:hypothetical protein
MEKTTCKEITEKSKGIKAHYLISFSSFPFDFSSFSFHLFFQIKENHLAKARALIGGGSGVPNGTRNAFRQPIAVLSKNKEKTGNVQASSGSNRAGFLNPSRTL